MRGVHFWSDARQRIHDLVEISGLESLNCPAGFACCAKRSAFFGPEALPPEGLSDVSRKQYVSESTQRWDNKAPPQHPDFRCSKQQHNVPLWLNNRHKPPVWVDSQLVTVDAGLKATPETVCSSVGVSRIFAPAAADSTLLELGLGREVYEEGPLCDAVNSLNVLVQRGRHVSSSLFYRVLKRCIQGKDLALGERIHAVIVKSGYDGDTFLATHLIGLYASHGKLEEAMGVFTRVPAPDAYNWATIIFAYARHGEATEAAKAIGLYRQLCQSTNIKPDDRLYSAVLKACAAAKDLDAGKEVHAHIVASSVKPDRFVQAGLVNMYVKCGGLEDARRVFDNLSSRDVVTWTSMIAGYAQQGRGEDAVKLYRSMLQEGVARPNSVTYVCLLQACANIGVGALDEGKQLHSEIKARGWQEDVVLAATLLHMYAKCGSLESARRVFDTLSKKDVVTWNTMIAGYAQKGLGQEALSLYGKMQQQQGGATPDSVTYVCLLQACASIGVGALEEGKQLHAEMKKRGLQEHVVPGGSLVNMYAKCGSLEDARILFDRLPERNVVAWNAMISGYVQQGKGEECLSLYRNMQQQEGLTPDCVTFVCLLQACASIGVGALDEGKQLHAEIRKQGGLLLDDVVLGGSLVNMYAKCGSLEDACTLFNSLGKRDVVTWTAIIAGYAQQGMGQEALAFYRMMCKDGLTPPDGVTFVCLLQACASVGQGALDEGKRLHAQIKDQGLQDDGVLGVGLVNMYAKCGNLELARSLFDKLGGEQKSVVAWNAMIAGYAQQGKGEEALSLYKSMQQQQQQQGPDGRCTVPDCVTYVCVLQACAQVGAGALLDGQRVHLEVKERAMQEDDGVLGVTLVNMYAKCGSLEEARMVFDKLSNRDVIAWTAMIAGYAQQGMGGEALALYKSMQQDGLSPPDSVTFVCLLQACANVGAEALDEGKQLHAEIRERGLQEDVVLGCGLVNMYAKCGNLEEARIVFDTLSSRDVVTWNSMIAAYAKQGMGGKALSLYKVMQEEGVTAPDCVTYLCLLQACANIGAAALDEGKLLHAEIEEKELQEDLAVGSSLVNMHAKCGNLEKGRKVFEELPNRDVVTWNSMIAGYAQQGIGEEALSLYRRMQLEGVVPDSVTYVCLLQACAAVAALPVGEQLHEEIQERGMQGDGIVGAALVNMYAKCGSMYDAHKVFDSLSDRSVEAWGALIGGYARQGDSQVVFDLVDRMRLEGMQPNAVTFLSVLTVCSHAGLVEKGREYFQAMMKEEQEHGLSATMEHYLCMVDLLGRAGHLEEALQMAKIMPFPPNDSVWHSLLGACRKWKNVEVGQQALEGALRVNEKDAASYVLMSNIYAGSHMWEAAREMQARRTQLGAWKKPGQSWWTDMGGVVHTFLVGDKQHPESEGIYARLAQLIPRMKKAGYVPHLESSLVDTPDHEKEAELCGHSEKLAIAYALNKTDEGTTIRIVKNLRVCEDCHTATAYISKVEKRTIICRDANRFHVYKEGKCSCGDYW